MCRLPRCQKDNGIDVVELQKKLTQALGKEIAKQEVDLKMTPRVL